MSVSTAQSTWNYFISDGGSGNSLVTWNVTGSVIAQPNSYGIKGPGPGIEVTIDAPGIFNDSYSAGGLQAIPTPDGSYFSYGDIYTAIVLYDTVNTSGGGNDRFGLQTSLSFGGGSGWTYNPASQSVVIPVDFSNFNPGTYQSVESGFSTPLTVNLTVVAIPESSTLPSALALAICAVVGVTLKISKQPLVNT